MGSWVDHIRRNFDEPDLGLGARYPWIAEFDRLLHAGDSLRMQRRLASITWDRWSLLAGKYTFGFEAVLLYLARWEIAFRWTRRNADLGRERFDHLLTEALGEYHDLYA